MDIAPDLKSWVVYLVLVMPGLISMKVYRLFFAVREVDWKGGLLDALFFSTLNLGLCLPILIPIHRGGFAVEHLGWYVLLLVVVLVVLPACWPVLLRCLLKWEWLALRIQLPYPTAWDYYFGRRSPAFVLIQLRNGAKIGGYYGSSSYATSFPTEGDIYLETTYEVDETGAFVGAIENSDGMIVRKDQYDLIEFVTPPEEDRDVIEETQ